MIVSRRGFLRFLGSALALGAATSAYGVIIEPFFRLRTTRYALTPPGWPADFPLRIAIVTDIHACDPWMNEGHIDDIVAMTNDAGADVILAGRASDTAIFAAYPTLHGFSEGLAWHAGKILECGAAAVVNRTAPDCMFAWLRRDHFEVEAPNPALRSSQKSA